MFKMPKYRNPISLIPGGCAQLLDYQAPVSLIDTAQYAFEELPGGNFKGVKELVLHAYRKNEEKEFVDEMDKGRVYGESGYKLSGLKGITSWLGQWMPLPFLHVREQNWEDGEGCRFEYGPTNWARSRLIIDPLNSDLLRLVLAFDMQVEEKNPGIYAALTHEDVDASAHFRLAWRLRDNTWFLKLPWVEEWLKEVWEAAHPRKKTLYGGDERGFEYQASYLLYLECIQKISNQCEVYVVRPDTESNVNVDLVLDIGNSRTTGILVESRPQSVTNLNDSYLLQLRDMSQPENVYTDPFETRIEFSEINFGNDALSLRSGRREAAFSWPSPARIGPEAARLATLSRSGTGSTGMSSPKRYLWDERDWKRSWRYNTQTEKAPYVTRGALAQKVNSSGTPLCCMDDPAFRSNKMLRQQERESAFESFFTPSSLMMFLFVEIIQQALLTINSPGQRMRREEPDKPRRLRQIIFTVPAGMPLAEQRIYRRWAKWAVKVLWEALGWEQYYEDKKPNARNRPSAKGDYRLNPDVRCEWDEATCTQLVFIYNEITRQFQGDVSLFYELMGREREINGRSVPTVRIAAIDIGGGTTDMSITTFELASNPGSSTRLAPHPEFHDGFNLAGDDILRSIIWEHVLPCVGTALEKAGVPDSQTALKNLFGRKGMDTSIEVTNRRIQFTRQIAVPVALCLLELYEKINPVYDTSKISFRISDCFIKPKGLENVKDDGSEKEALFGRLYPFPGQGALNYVRDYVYGAVGDDNFNVLDVQITMDPAIMAETTSATLSNILQQLCEVIKAYECDVLLLTGRPTRWPGVVNRIMSFMAVPPGRIFPMGDYHIGSWYPFSDALGNMTDPKTTVVVGAILCALAEGQLEGFSFDPSTLIVPSTARYIGEIETNGKLTRNKVWFTVNPETGESSPEEAEIEWNGPISVGFRQLETERWPTTRYYVLDSVDDAKKPSLKVKLKFVVPTPEEISENIENRDDGEFEILSITDAKTEDDMGKCLDIRLQTLPRDDGFWMDTGEILDD